VKVSECPELCCARIFSVHVTVGSVASALFSAFFGLLLLALALLSLQPVDVLGKLLELLRDVLQ
jgi:hypothetical protein